jgi:predicted flap endonuclease-1-like 5' DNA nuclease
MSSLLFSILAQTETGTGSDWNWLLIFIVFVIILVIALVIQARFSTIEAEELAHETHHEEDTHEEAEPELAPVAVTEEPELESEVPDLEDAAESDDLKQIEGIGPKVADLLSENGITTFSQLGDKPVDELMEILETAQLQMMNPESWPQQAKLAAAGEWEALEKLQDELKGGR